MYTGPIAGVLTKIYGCRRVAIIGTVIAAFGFLISIFAPNIYFMFFSFGLVAGRRTRDDNGSMTHVSYGSRSQGHTGQGFSRSHGSWVILSGPLPSLRRIEFT